MLSLVKKTVITEIMGVIFYELMRLLKILKNIHQRMNIYATKALWVCSETELVPKDQNLQNSVYFFTVTIL